jgi:hypothetical protein
VLGQIGQHEQLHTVLRYLAVGRDVPAGDSGIDRYLSGIAASRREGEQVNGRLTTLALDMLNGFWCQIDLHRLPRWLVAPAGLKNGMTWVFIDRGLTCVYDAPNPVGVQSPEANP